jgi:outer membrane protein OmpA-like peptidoglycan-associated protein
VAPQTMPVPVMNAAVANSGGGAGATNWGGDPSTIGVTLGASGIVIIRYVVTSAPAPAPAPDGPVAVAEPDPTPTPVVVPAPPKSPSASSDPLDPIVSPAGPSAAGAGLPPGESELFVNGQPQTLSVAAEGQRSKPALLFSAEGWQLQLSSVGYGSNPIGLSRQRSLVFESAQSGGRQSGIWAQGDPMAVFGGSGFRPNSNIRFYILPNVLLGQTVSNAAGAYSGRLAVPSNLPSGPYTLQVNGYAPDGAVRSLNIGITIRALRPAQIKVAKARVFFDPLSANLSSAGKSHLRSLVKRTGSNGIKTVAVGYVQPTARIDNDQSLSTQRARNLARYLRSIGLEGTYVTLGKGVASQQGATARRVTVKVTYRDVK